MKSIYDIGEKDIKKLGNCPLHGKECLECLHKNNQKRCSTNPNGYKAIIGGSTDPYKDKSTIITSTLECIEAIQEGNGTDLRNNKLGTRGMLYTVLDFFLGIADQNKK